MKLTSVYVHSLSYFLRQNQTLIMGYHSLHVFCLTKIDCNITINALWIDCMRVKC